MRKKLILALAAVMICLFTASVTVYAYLKYFAEAKVADIQTADYAVDVIIVAQEQTADLLVEDINNSIDKYVFTGEEGENGVSFNLTATGTASTGYCEIVVDDKTYFTEAIAQGENFTVTIKAKEGTEVQFLAHWGSPDVSEEVALIKSGDAVGEYVPVATASPSPAPSISPSPSPSVSPSPSKTPIPTFSPVPTGTMPTTSPVPAETPMPTTSPEPSETPVSTGTPVPTTTPVSTETPAPTATPMPTASSTSTAEPSVSPETTEVSAESPETTVVPTASPEVTNEEETAETETEGVS